MSKNIFVDYEGKHAKVKCNDFNSFKEGIERKLRVSLNDHRLEYHNTSRDEWIGIFDDDDLEDITEETQVRLISESGKKIYVTYAVDFQDTSRHFTFLSKQLEGLL